MLYKVISMVAVLMVPPAMGTLYGMTQLPVEKPGVAKLAGCAGEPTSIVVTRYHDSTSTDMAATYVGDCTWTMEFSYGDVYGEAGAWDIDYNFWAPGGVGSDSSANTSVTGTYSAGSVVVDNT